MLPIALINRIHDLRSLNPGYFSALASGYLLMGANILVQIVLTPFYLKYLGVHQFGLLMILLSLINFTAVGIGWMSGGLVRVIGECWAKSDLDGLRNTFVVGKYVFTIYALLAVSVGTTFWYIFRDNASNGDTLTISVLLAGLYLVLNYEAIPERQAFVGVNRQATGNYIELARILLFAIMTFFLLPKLGDMSAVWIALMSGVLFQRVVTGRYWARQVGGMGWRRFSPEMKPIFKRLAGRQGAGYMTYGALLLVLQADTMIVGIIGGAEAAGQFVLLWKIPEAIGLLLWRIPSTMEPRVIQMDVSGQQENLRSIFIKGRRWFFMLVVFVALIYMLTGQWLAEAWVGEHAPDEGWMYIVAGFALFFNAFARWPISFAYALIKLAELVKVAALEVVCKLALTIVLFQYYNIAAPIIASVITHIFYVALAYQKIIKLGV